mgnify:CR=1 FL=1
MVIASGVSVGGGALYRKNGKAEGFLMPEGPLGRSSPGRAGGTMINRQLEIIYILMNKGTVTAEELAGHFEVSTRTIYRDV